MPVRPVRDAAGRIRGYRWGDSGKVYTGPDAREKASRQGRAVEARRSDDSESVRPPAAVASAARRALDLRAKVAPSRRGMTPVGLRRASQLANREPVSIDTIRRMVRYFDRHASDADAKGDDARGFWGNDSNPSKGWQAWLGWGGYPGRAWARRVLRQAEDET